MANDLLDRADLDFILHDWLRHDDPAPDAAAPPVERDMVDAILDLSEALAAERFLSHYKEGDRDEPRLLDGKVRISPQVGEALRRFAELGLFGASFGEELGGLGLPRVVTTASFLYFSAANVATAAYAMLTTANARLISVYGTPAQIDAFARPQIAGRWFGTMCLSEPNAGSSLSDIRTRAEPDGEDSLGRRYRLFGNKMWISGGDQDASENIVHLVLAKTPDAAGALPAGTTGISLFIVPKLIDGRPNDVVVAGLNHKLGYRATANCALNFGETTGATGWLVGEVGQGLAQMFHMMNEARINVGVGATALGYRGHRLSVAYARERRQGRSRARKDSSQIAIIEHPDVKRMLLAQKAYVEGALALCLFCAWLVDRDDEDSGALLDVLTPIAKTWPAEYALLANDLAIQIHGGCGYTRDFDVEQLWRDNRLNAIHEGTTGIQAIDLVGRKLRHDPRGLAALDLRIDGTVARADAIKDLAPFCGPLRSARKKVGETVAMLRDRAPEFAIENATPFLRAIGHLVVGWIWLEQAVVAHDTARRRPDNRRFDLTKKATCKFFFENELPQIDVWLAVVNSVHDGVAAVPSDLF